MFSVFIFGTQMRLRKMNKKKIIWKVYLLFMEYFDKFFFVNFGI